jgi:hypothetical protein
MTPPAIFVLEWSDYSPQITRINTDFFTDFGRIFCQNLCQSVKSVAKNTSVAKFDDIRLRGV